MIALGLILQIKLILNTSLLLIGKHEFELKKKAKLLWFKA